MNTLGVSSPSTCLIEELFTDRRPPEKESAQNTLTITRDQTFTFEVRSLMSLPEEDYQE